MDNQPWLRKSRMAVLAGAGLAFSLVLNGCARQDDASAARIDELEKRLTLVEDVNAIKNLTRAYGYYIDKKIWSETVELFSDDAVVEISGRGVYKGKESVTNLFTSVIGSGEDGLADGELSNHMVLQGVVEVNPDGKTAVGRWRAFIQIGVWQRVGLWAEGPYNIEYKKVDGVWKMSKMHWYGTYFTPFEQGWHKSAFPNNPSSSGEFPPDEPMSLQYDTYPGHYVPPFNYPNPVTGREWTEEDSRRLSTWGMTPDNMPANPTPSGGNAGENPTPSGDR